MKRLLSLTLLVSCAILLVFCSITPHPAIAQAPADDAKTTLAKLGASRGLCVVLGDPRAALELARGSELLVYVQSPDAGQVEETRRTAEAAGLLGTRLFVQKGPWSRIHLADNLADAVVVRGDAER